MKLQFLHTFVGLTLALSACSSDRPDETQHSTKTSTTPIQAEAQQAFDASQSPSTEFKPLQIERFGIEVCDQYVEQIESCFNRSTLDANALAILWTGYEQSIDQWRRMSKSEHLRGGVASVCEANLKAMLEVRRGLRCE